MMQERKKCNQCGKDILVFDGNNTEDCLKVKKQWGYFSKRDGIEHSFCLCEHCYDKLLEGFVIPVQVSETLEYL